ncbi:MAG: hypothetical protein WCP52_00780 [Bacteroidota bacterium]
MIIVVEGLKGKNAADKVKFGGNNVLKITGNSYFTDGTTQLAALKSTTEDLKTANDGGKASAIAVAENAFDIANKVMVMYIQTKIMGLPDDLAKEMVDSTEYQTKKNGKPVIADISAKKGTEANTVVLRKKVTTGKKKVAYIWQKATNIGDAANWDYCKFSTNASVTVDGLLSNVRYYFRVAVVIGDVTSEYSVVTSCFVD